MVRVDDMLHPRLEPIIGHTYGPARFGVQSGGSRLVGKPVRRDRRAGVGRGVRGGSLRIRILPGKAVRVSGMVAVGGDAPEELLDQRLVAWIEAHPRAGRLP